MGRIRIGDTVAFRRDVVQRCGGSEALAASRATVIDIVGDWLFLAEKSGTPKVMPREQMCRVAANGVILELVRNAMPRAMP